MEAWAREYLDVFSSRIEHIARQLFEAVQRDPSTQGSYKLDDFIQIIRGAYVMMEEELEGRGTDAREAYLEGVIPGMIGAGESLAMMVAQTEGCAIRIHSDIFSRISKENHAAAQEFFIAWQVRYLFDLVTIALKCGARV